jgi:UDP-N-acetylmuramoyl-tripeptide--D-alanyl-D-alanine ligase
MRPRMLSDVARAVSGTLEGDDVEVRAVTTDSRDVSSGSLFVALHGEHQDGHAFVADAFARGAVAAMVDERHQGLRPLVSVPSTGDALLDLAADERTAFRGTLVGITGANGKTSTKDMTAAVVATRFRTHASPRSFNNEVGLPATLLGSPEGTEVVVAEMGARRVGDVALLCRVARPDVVTITNVGVAHMEVFGSWESIVEASAEPVVALPSEGIAVLNADDPVVAGYAALTEARVMMFGRSSKADVRAEEVSIGPDGRAGFAVVVGDERVPTRLRVAGEHMVANALAAVAVGSILGVEVVEAVGAVAAAPLSPWRMETFETSEGVRVLNDAYNANPESVSAALKTARRMAGERRLIAVLGPMAELGPITLAEHERVGELAARIRVDRLITVGVDAEAIAVAGIREGVEPDQVASYVELEGALEDVRAHARPGDLVLVKASRVAGLERLAEALR